LSTLSSDRPSSVLVLEDHDFQRAVAIALLKDCGIEDVLSAATGDAALKLARSHPIHVLVCDLQTPGMDGVELLRHVAEEKLANAVIIASAMDPALIGTVEEMARSHGLQVLGAVEKPLTRSRLQSLLDQYRKPSAPKQVTAITPMTVPEIAQALRDDQFIPYFQPKVSVSTRELVGLEALIRWRHPTRGLIPPIAFIPVAEDTPLIHDLTWMMVDKSIAQWRGWGSRGWRLSVSINFSVHVVSEIGVVDRMADAIGRHRVEPGNVVLEVTESTLCKNAAHMLEALARLRLKGFGLSIDDFGTGYSSMQQLSRISFTELKIDRAFVHGAASRRHLRTILESSLDLARKLKLKSVAEGVETEEDWNLLRELGCDTAQGYLISKPMPEEQLWPWYERWLSG
jgi:EAL domain-containing protein (putative c-di-GMP-specific phosphodiesterase class I)/CheY-like chemotaxis protein